MTAPTKITASKRYFLPGTTKVLVLPAVANLATGPTLTELNAGTDISDEVASITGFVISGDNMQAPDLGKRFNPQVPGRLNGADSGLTCWASKDGVDVRTVLTLDQRTFVVFLDGGNTAGNPMDVYECDVLSVGKVREIEGIGRLEVKFSIVDYAENLDVPAA